MTTPSWQPDPFHRHEYRWWDSQQWTEHVSDRGVVAIDPAMPMPEVPHPTWAAPHLPPPSPPDATPATPAVPLASSPPKRPRHNGLLAGTAVVVAAALGVGGYLLLRNDDPNTTTLSGDTTISTDAASTPSTTTGSTSGAIPTTAPAPTTTIPKMLDSQRLISAMPTALNVPSDWSLYSDAKTGHEPDLTSGSCGGINSTGLALNLGSVAQVNGPTFDLPSHGWFGIEAFSFKSPQAASAFLAAYAAQAALCATTPITSASPEADEKVFANGYGAEAVWQLSETAFASPETSSAADEAVAVTDATKVGTSVGTADYGFVRGEELRVERYGRFVVEYWLDGEYGQYGFSNTPDWAYQPTHDDLLAVAGAVRPMIAAALNT